MDIGREVRRYRAEPLTSPVPGAAPAPVEPEVREASEVPEPSESVDATREGVAEAHA